MGDSIRRGSFLGLQQPWQPLPYAPPTLSSPRVVTVDQFFSSRFIALNTGEDLILNLGEVQQVLNVGEFGDAQVEIRGGRHVVVIGGHFPVSATPTTALTTPANATQTSISVTSTAGFPTTGQLRLDGEFIRYSGATATSFTGLSRNAGYFNDSPVSSLTHSAGATVHMGEAFRSALSFIDQTGVVHVEGVLMDGSVSDGIRFQSVAPTTVLQVQNCRIGPIVTSDTNWATDGHPDCIQLIGGGGEARLARSTFLTQNGRCILNSSGDGGNTPIARVVLRDVDGVGLPGHGTLFSNNYPVTQWESLNVWYSTAASNQYSSDLAGKFSQQPAADPAWQACPPGVAGADYVSPGYAP